MSEKEIPFIDGVNVLHTYEVEVSPMQGVLTGLACFIGVGMAVIFLGFLENSKWIMIISAVCVAIAVIISILLEGRSYIVMRYECTINDDVTMLDILKNYNVIEQRGAIWILEERKPRRECY